MPGPGFPRFPSYVSVNQSELGSSQQFLEKPKMKKIKHQAGKSSREMPAHRMSQDSVQWGRVLWQAVEVFFAESVGTAMLLFFGCMGLITWTDGEPLPAMQGAIIFSVVVATIIQIFGHISAAHLNPAVTIAFMVLGQITPAMALVYILSECIGAVLGFGLLILLTPVNVMSKHISDVACHCCTVPNPGLSDVQAVAMEFFATCFLVMMVCACADQRNADKSDSTPLKFGCTILAMSIAVGPYTGASMNPARTLGPAIWNGVWTGHWIYWLGPCLSGFSTAIFYQALFNRQGVKEPPFTEEVPLNQIKVNVQRFTRTEEST